MNKTYHKRNSFQQRNSTPAQSSPGRTYILGRIPKISGKEVPLHYFSKTLNNFTFNRKDSALRLLPDPLPVTQ